MNTRNEKIEPPVTVTALRFLRVEGRKGTPFQNFVFRNCSFKRDPKAILPEWSKCKPEEVERQWPETFRYAEGFVFDNVDFSALRSAVGIWYNVAQVNAAPKACHHAIYGQSTRRQADRRGRARRPCAVHLSSDAHSQGFAGRGFGKPDP